MLRESQFNYELSDIEKDYFIGRLTEWIAQVVRIGQVAVTLLHPFNEWGQILVVPSTIDSEDNQLQFLLRIEVKREHLQTLLVKHPLRHCSGKVYEVTARLNRNAITHQQHAPVLGFELLNLGPHLLLGRLAEN